MSLDLVLDDPTSLSGMSLLINTNNVPPGYNPTDIEERIIGSTQRKSAMKSIPFTQELENQLDSLTANYSGTDPFSLPSSLSSSVSSSASPSAPAFSAFSSPYQSNTNAGYDSMMGLGSGGMDELDQIINSKESNFSQAQSGGYSSAYPGTASYTGGYQDQNLNFMTNEQKRQSVIGEVFNDINKERGDGNLLFSMEKEKEEDEKQHKLEHISFLMESLSGEGEDLANIPKVSGVNTLNEIDQVLKRLLLRNDRKRCGSFAEEVILLGAHGIEWVCDGKKSYLGFKPDMTDWHKSVQTKLRRMRYDTSNVVATIMDEYKMGSATRILFELIPSMFLYSRMRKSQHKDIITDDEFNAGVNKLRDLEISS